MDAIGTLKSVFKKNFGENWQIEWRNFEHGGNTFYSEVCECFELLEHQQTQTKTDVLTTKTQLTKPLVQTIIADMKSQHLKRYGLKMVDKAKYRPMRNTYKIEHLWDDLEFTLNHIHLPNQPMKHN